MKFDSSLFLKWIDLHKTIDSELDLNLVDHCVLVGRDASHQVIGFTAFESFSLSESFFERFLKRRKTANLDVVSYELYVPAFLKQRVATLVGKMAITDLEVFYSPFIHIHRGEKEFIVRNRLRVLNVDDSSSILKLLEHTMEQIDFVELVGQVSNPREAVSQIEALQPDVITMDIQMPFKSGVDLVRELLARKAYRIIMVSSLNLEEGSLVFEALNAGAYEFIQKPRLDERDYFTEEIKLKLLEAVSHKPQKKKLPNRIPSLGQQKISADVLWCFGASTGGTTALTQILTSLPDGIPPVLVVQHIPPVFSKAFAESLDKLCPFKVKEAEDGEPLLPNHVYVAPGGIHMKVRSEFGKLFVFLEDSSPVNRFKPSVDFLFSNVSQLKGFKVVAGLLTGMGKDGAQGLLQLRQHGAVTIAQDEASSAVYGMPRQAVEIGAAQFILPIEEISHKFMDQSLKPR